MNIDDTQSFLDCFDDLFDMVMNGSSAPTIFFEMKQRKINKPTAIKIRYILSILYIERGMPREAERFLPPARDVLKINSNEFQFCCKPVFIDPSRYIQLLSANERTKLWAQNDYLNRIEQQFIGGEGVLCICDPLYYIIKAENETLLRAYLEKADIFLHDTDCYSSFMYIAKKHDITMALRVFDEYGYILSDDLSGTREAVK